MTTRTIEILKRVKYSNSNKYGSTTSGDYESKTDLDDVKFVVQQIGHVKDYDNSVRWSKKVFVRMVDVKYMYLFDTSNAKPIETPEGEEVLYSQVLKANCFEKDAKSQTMLRAKILWDIDGKQYLYGGESSFGSKLFTIKEHDFKLPPIRNSSYTKAYLNGVVGGKPKVHTGPRGGKYTLVNGKKKYL